MGVQLIVVISCNKFLSLCYTDRESWVFWVVLLTQLLLQCLHVPECIASQKNSTCRISKVVIAWENAFYLKQHYVTLTATPSFEKRNLMMHVNTLSYFTEKVSSGFHSDVLRLLCCTSVLHGGSWKQHAGRLQTEAATAAAGGFWGQLC